MTSEVRQIIDLKTGKVILPEKCRVVKSTLDENSKYVGLLIDGNGELPWLAVFSKEPMYGISVYQEEAVIEDAIKKYCQQEQISNAIAEKILRDATVVDLNRLRFYPVPEVLNTKELYCDKVGILRN